MGKDSEIILVPVKKGSLEPVETPYKFDDLIDFFPLDR